MHRLSGEVGDSRGYDEGLLGFRKLGSSHNKASVNYELNHFLSDLCSPELVEAKESESGQWVEAADPVVRDLLRMSQLLNNLFDCVVGKLGDDFLGLAHKN